MSAMRAPVMTFSPADYLLLDRSHDYRSEYVDGYIYAMSGASPTHEAIVANLCAALLNALEESPCRVYSSNLRVKSPSDAFYGYPDATVFCEELAFHDDLRDVVTNPQVIFEILSPSTEAFDRGEKFERYREIETLKEYILISQDQPKIELRHRVNGDKWQTTTVSGLEESLDLPSINRSLKLSDIYRRVAF